MPRINKLGLLIICISLVGTGALILDAPILITKACALANLIITAIEKSGVGK